MTRWEVHGSRSLYESEWVRLELADVELTDGTRVDHHVIRVPFDVVSLVVCDADRGVLLIWRHRFITDTWAWDVPAGRVAPGEEPGDAAVRAAIEETGWRPGAVRRLGLYHPSPGISDQRFGVYVAETAEQVAEPNPNEVERVEWVPVERVRQLLRDGEVDGLSLTSLLWALSADELTELRLDSSDLEPGITVDGVTYRWRGQLIDAELVSLVRSHGGRAVRGWWDQIRPHSLGWVTARAADGAVVGFVNIAWDGRDHSFLLDPKTHGEFQRKASGLAWSSTRSGTPEPRVASGSTSTSRRSWSLSTSTPAASGRRPPGSSTSRRSATRRTETQRMESSITTRTASG